MSVHKTRKKKPITIEYLELLYQKLAVKICILDFCSFLRYSEIINLRRSDRTFHDKFIKVFIEKRKTDVYREGD